MSLSSQVIRYTPVELSAVIGQNSSIEDKKTALALLGEHFATVNMKAVELNAEAFDTRRKMKILQTNLGIPDYEEPAEELPDYDAKEDAPKTKGRKAKKADAEEVVVEENADEQPAKPKKTPKGKKVATPVVEVAEQTIAETQPVVEDAPPQEALIASPPPQEALIASLPAKKPRGGKAKKEQTVVVSEATLVASEAPAIPEPTPPVVTESPPSVVSEATLVANETPAKKPRAKKATTNAVVEVPVTETQQTAPVPEAPTVAEVPAKKPRAKKVVQIDEPAIPSQIVVPSLTNTLVPPVIVDDVPATEPQVPAKKSRAKKATTA
jgi:hypothetical protein